LIRLAEETHFRPAAHAGRPWLVGDDVRAASTPMGSCRPTPGS